MYLIAVGVWAITALLGRGNARGAEFVRGAHRETELRKKLKPTQPANSSVRPWKGGVPIYKVQFGGGANYLLATHTRTAPVHADRKATQTSHGHGYNFVAIQLFLFRNLIIFECVIRPEAEDAF